MFDIRHTDQAWERTFLLYMFIYYCSACLCSPSPLSLLQWDVLPSCFTSLTMKQMLCLIILLAEISLWSNLMLREQLQREIVAALPNAMWWLRRCRNSCSEAPVACPSPGQHFACCCRKSSGFTVCFTLELNWDNSCSECQCFPSLETDCVWLHQWHAFQRSNDSPLCDSVNRLL